MTQKEKLCNNALLLIGSAGLSSFDDGSAGAEIAKNLFSLTYKSLLTETRWHFATRSVVIPKIADNQKYVSNFQLPQDCLYVIKANINPYEIYERTIRVEQGVENIQIDYIFEPEVQNTPPYFQQALEFKLAAKFSIPVAEDTQKASTYTALYMQEVKRAKYLDSTSRTVDRIEQGAYITARY